MGWSGGTFSRDYNWTTDAAGSFPNIEASRMDGEDNNFATGINACLTKDGSNTPSGNLPMGGQRHTGVGNAAALTDYASAADVIDQHLTFYVDSGSGNNFAITPSPAISAYAEGQRFVFRATHGNTGACDLNVNGLGAIAIQTNDGSALSSGAIATGGYYEVIYDANATPDRWVLVSPISNSTNVDHDSTTNFVANEHIDHTSVTITAGSGLSYSVGGTDISADATIDVDLTALTQADATDIAAGDELLLNDGGTNKAVRWQDFGIPQTNTASTTPFSAADLTYANRWYNCTAATAVSAVIPANASVAYPVGTTFAFHQNGAGQITVSVTTDTLRAPNGAKTNTQYSTIFVTKIGSTEWVVTGDAST